MALDQQLFAVEDVWHPDAAGDLAGGVYVGEVAIDHVDVLACERRRRRERARRKQVVGVEPDDPLAAGAPDGAVEGIGLAAIGFAYHRDALVADRRRRRRRPVV